MPRQVRAVISPDLVPIAESVMAATGIATHSQLVCLLIKNFGTELSQRLKGETTTQGRQS
ncbi:MAG: hypothetical protein KME28_13140 [Pelatocladus maniniholoensis HA4357-MV3]|jgi:hypothetical protein|uniref:Uncharacterized protein n=1 Tax=Pelatocladus maniniholoensis HA4357-MV3 TaxID=1117104 RepID=A0A9E3LTC4_9NOST|nr:hypothetical protein [Pelatocladus maniniholoensis HA4357-MV3]BAZ65551.1 hypothetical protein NIES4106_02900 [Fischerella sp. NIES-4106]